MSYLKDNDRFMGTGEKDANGLTLKEFLDSYDPRKYDSPCNTVDMLVFRSPEPYRRKEQPLKLLLIKRKNHPSIGFWATPGGFADVYENLEDSAKRELMEETGAFPANVFFVLNKFEQAGLFLEPYEIEKKAP